MAVSSETEICNMALGSIGTRSSIASLSENSAEAAACKLYYHNCRDELLRAAHWDFARTQVPLAVLKDATLSPPQTVPSPWLYEYAIPSDLCMARYIVPMFYNAPASVPGASSMPFYIGQKVRFLIMNDPDQYGNPNKVIVTNQASPAILVYTSRITNVAMFDDQFVTALTAFLAAHLAMPLKGDKGMEKSKFELANAKTVEARRTNGNEDGPTVIDNIPDWIAVRGYASDWAYPPGSMFFIAPQSLTMIS